MRTCKASSRRSSVERLSRRSRALTYFPLAIALVLGCAHIESSSEVKLIPKRSSTPLVIGGPRGQITARGAKIVWRQHASTLEVEVHELRACRQIVHHPVIRMESVKRKAGIALPLEYVSGAGLLAFGLVGLIRPDLFSQEAINADGEIVEDLGRGYRIGGIFTGLGAVMLGVGVYDTVRARDQAYYTDAFRIALGDRVDCAAPVVPLANYPVELIVPSAPTDEESDPPGWRGRAATDDAGVVRFALTEELEAPPLAGAETKRGEASPDAAVSTDVPPEGTSSPAPAATPPAGTTEGATAPTTSPSEGGGAPLPADPASAEPGSPSPASPRVLRAVLRIDAHRAVAIDFVVPFDSDEASDHRGEAKVPPRERMTVLRQERAVTKR